MFTVIAEPRRFDSDPVPTYDTNPDPNFCVAFLGLHQKFHALKVVSRLLGQFNFLTDQKGLDISLDSVPEKKSGSGK